MLLSQTKEATKAFVSFLETHLAEVHPSYQRNRQVKGIRHEYIREVENGLWAIHSVLCKKGTYHHCFCLSLHHVHPGPYLYSPFTIGGRCDHNYSVTSACHRDLGLSPVDPVNPFRMSDSHQFRKGSERIIPRCLAEAEARLLPFYQSVWTQTRPALKALLDYAGTTSPEEMAACADTYPGPLHELSCHMLKFRHLHDSLPPEQRPAFFAATARNIPETLQGVTIPR